MTEPRLSHVMVFCKDLRKLARYEASFELVPEPSSDPEGNVIQLFESSS
jgi:hypothetical protein